MSNLLEIKKDIVRTAKQAFESKLFVGTSGNLSYYVPEEELMLITPTCVRYETMTEEDIVVMKLDGTIVEGKYQPSSEWRMHGAMFEKCPGVRAVIHTHSPYATAFATVRRGIPVILIEMTPFVGGDIQCAGFQKPGTRELGLGAAEVVNTGRGGCLLSSHGVLTVGEDFGQAYIRAEYIEEAAQIYHYGLQIGEPVVLDKELL